MDMDLKYSASKSLLVFYIFFFWGEFPQLTCGINESLETAVDFGWLAVNKTPRVAIVLACSIATVGDEERQTRVANS